MTSDTEKKVPGEAPKRRNTRVVLFLGIAAALAAGLGVYLAARRASHPLPEMPRAAFHPAEIDAALAALRARAQAFTPRGDELRLVDEMRTMHVAEVSSSRGAERKERSLALFDTFRKTASSVAGADRARFIALGESLAVEMQDAVDGVLSLGRTEGLDRALRQPSAALDRAVSAGGLFLVKAAERGLIGDRGELRGPRLLPEVLFRKRWCGAVGLGGAEGFSDVEARAAADFTAAFSSQVDDRLEAVESLRTSQPAFDATVARALVLHAAGRDQEARRAVDAALVAGRKDDAILLLRDALR